MKNKQAQKKLIQNPKKQLNGKRDQFHSSIYEHAILTVANEIFPIDNNSFNYYNLPLVSWRQNKTNFVVDKQYKISTMYSIVD